MKFEKSAINEVFLGWVVGGRGGGQAELWSVM